MNWLFVRNPRAEVETQIKTFPPLLPNKKSPKMDNMPEYEHDIDLSTLGDVNSLQ